MNEDDIYERRPPSGRLLRRQRRQRRQQTTISRCGWTEKEMRDRGCVGGGQRTVKGERTRDCQNRDREGGGAGRERCGRIASPPVPGRSPLRLRINSIAIELDGTILNTQYNYHLNGFYLILCCSIIRRGLEGRFECLSLSPISIARRRWADEVVTCPPCPHSP